MKNQLLYCGLLFLILCPGCNLFLTSPPDEKKPMYTFIHQERFNTITASGKFICLIDQERPPSQQTIRDMIRIAEQSALTVEFRTIPYSLRIPALLRAGKADVAIGSYTINDALEKHLDFLTVRTAVCLLRKDDPEWKKILTSASVLLNVPTEKK